ncbi:SAM-dependent methyltransferase [Streptosporangium sp. NPDC087985]|uniref:SAM-dependent methyltransferase n=1 Tax=Streptosporangium sp. NPDC087985 TaxID=3366196 RepID=UPI003824B3C3
MSHQEKAPSGVDPSIPSVARMYDYYLGGKDNFAADRIAAEKIIEIVPNARESARTNREFLSRAVRHMVNAGVRQFIDIGAGLPTQQNVHEVALNVAPKSRIVYVDNDPLVLVHGRALLADNPNTIVVDADLNDPGSVLGHEAVRAHIDFGQPVGILLLAVLHFVPDDRDAARIVRELCSPLTAGSHLVISHGHAGELPSSSQQRGRDVYTNTGAGGVVSRSRQQLAAWFDGLELAEPGVVPVQAWRPENEWEEAPDVTKPGLFGGVGRIP